MCIYIGCKKIKEIDNMKYAYPAILTYDKDENCYYVNFPDIEGCFTDGKTLPEAIEMGEDALALMLCQIEDDNAPIPVPTDIKAIKAAPDETVSLIFADTMEYRRIYDNRAVKKTLSVPSWLNVKAEQLGINFSYVLRQALIKEVEKGEAVTHTVKCAAKTAKKTKGQSC